METPNSSDFRNDLGTIKDNVKKGANSLKQNVQQEIEATDWQARYEDISERARQAADVSTDFVKAHPFYTLLGAATVGFVAGMLLRRK